MSEANGRGEVIDRIFAAMAAGDLAAARAEFAPQAVVWHSFDRLARSLDETMGDWQGLCDAFPERGIDDVRRHAAGEGVFVQQHMFVVRDKAGARRAWPVCIVVQTEAGRIVRLDEYIDRASSIPVAEGAVTTPGF